MSEMITNQFFCFEAKRRKRDFANSCKNERKIPIMQGLRSHESENLPPA